MMMLEGKDYRLEVPRAIQVSPTILQRYQGKYKFTAKELPDSIPREVVIWWRNNKLFLDVPVHGQVRLYSKSKAELFTMMAPFTFTIILDDEGKATGLVARGSGLELSAKKVE